MTADKTTATVEGCDYHYYFDARFPAFQFGLPEGHEGEPKDVSQIVYEELKAKYSKDAQDRLVSRIKPDN